MSPVARINSFIHAPTFDPNEKRPELLLSMAAAGAVLTSDPTLTKLGYAMQETVRPAVGTLWESNNTLIRNLELIQAFLIHLEVGIWSGHSRKIEITESFLQPPVTMLRRAGKFRASGYYSVEVTKASKGQELHALWQSWLEQETFKRTVFRILDHDTNSSMCLLVNPLMSYAEMTLPLPSSPTLWSQSNAEGWKLVYLALDQDQKCSLSEYIYSPADSNKLKHALDLELANRAFLSSAWNLSWECIQLRSLTNSPSTRLSVALLSSRQDEITKLLGNFRITMDDQSLANTQLTMRLEHIMLHLHLPLEDIQVFAGIEGADQASKVCPEVMKWTASEAARRSIWHAGQIVRQARLASKGSLQGPVAFMIYHASLALWAYALLCDRITNRSNPIAPDEVVWLDGEDSIALQRFLQLGSGTPSLNGVQSPGYPPKQISLKEPDDVIKAVACALVANYEGLPRPASVDGLIKLMQTLQKSPRASADEIL
jgi:hypothetical protein